MTDMERYSGGLELPSDPLAAALITLAEARIRELAMARDIAQTQGEVAGLGVRLDMISMTAAENRQWMTLLGFVERYQVSPVDTTKRGLAHLGMKIANWHRQLNHDYDHRGAFSQEYGGVNKYQTRHLYTYFTTSGHTLNRALYESDHPGR